MPILALCREVPGIARGGPEASPKDRHNSRTVRARSSALTALALLRKPGCRQDVRSRRGRGVGRDARLQRGSSSAQRSARFSALLPFLVTAPPVRANTAARLRRRTSGSREPLERVVPAAEVREDSEIRSSIGRNGRDLVPMPMLIGRVRTAGPFPAERLRTMPSSASWTDVVCSSVSSSSARISFAIGLLFTSPTAGSRSGTQAAR